MSNKIPDKLLEKLLKVKALADGGATPEERDTAQQMLEAMLKRNKFTLEDLLGNQEQKKWYLFRWIDEFEETILTQVLFVALDWPDSFPIRRWDHDKRAGVRKGFSVELTAVQYAEVSVAYEHYKAEWKRQVANFMSAFLQVNDLVRPFHKQTDDEVKEEPLPMTPEKRENLRQMFALMDKINRSTPLKQLEE
jgi:hypothetical protein